MVVETEVANDNEQKYPVCKDCGASVEQVLKFLPEQQAVSNWTGDTLCPNCMVGRVQKLPGFKTAYLVVVAEAKIGLFAPMPVSIM